MALREDPAGGHFFALEIDGTEVAHFKGCSGIKTSTEVFEIEEGGLNSRTHKFAGEATWDNVTLQIATNVSSALFSWRDRCRAGDMSARTSGAITMYGVDGRMVERFDLVDVWPVRWSGPDLDAAVSELAVEELELSHEGVRVS